MNARIYVIAWCCAVAPASDRGPLAAQEIGWRANGGNVQGTRYSPAAVITRDNVAQLEVAWTYRTGEVEPRFATAKPTSFEATPLVDDGTMYIGTPLGRVIALDAATGRELWVFDPEIRRDITYGDFASRGVSLWIDEASAPNTECYRTIFVATAESQLFALDAGDGRPCSAFGDGGMIDLTQGLRIAPFEPAAYTVTSPPVVVSDVVITGSSIGDNTRPDLPSGEVRAFDARSGSLVWSWDPIPQDPRDPAYGEWGGPLAHGTGGARLIQRESVDLDRAREESERLNLDYEYNGMFGTPYVMRRRILRSPSGLPCTPPPFGTLAAIDLDSGERLWDVPLGTLQGLMPEGAAAPAEWGSVNLGGPIVTAGGLVFIGAALDGTLKAYDIDTGHELWRGALPASGKATPMTYRLASGEQFVVIAVGGGDVFGTGDSVVAFSLPH